MADNSSAMSEPTGENVRKIIHVDMDAFYASVEQRDAPELRGKPVVVAWRGARSVVCAASYEARKFGIRSAMPAVRAERLCPDAVFVPPDFVRYRTASRAVRDIFSRHAELVEPLSLDEAYLDVTRNKTGLATATEVAQVIRQQIFDELNLTASAGIAPNKFLAKIASDWEKPNGQYVIKPSRVLAFLTPLPVGKIPGVGKVTQQKMRALGIERVGDLRQRERAELEHHFGKYGNRLYKLARGIDNSKVTPNRPTQSISAEDTFAVDIPLNETHETLRRLAARVWKNTQKERRVGRTVVLKLKTADFRILTRSLTPSTPPSSEKELIRFILDLCEKVGLPDSTRYRLVGVGMGNFREPDDPVFQADLFSGSDATE